jgi:hypothetical protein
MIAVLVAFVGVQGGFAALTSALGRSGEAISTIGFFLWVRPIFRR